MSMRIHRRIVLFVRGRRLDTIKLVQREVQYISRPLQHTDQHVIFPHNTTQHISTTAVNRNTKLIASLSTIFCLRCRNKRKIYKKKKHTKVQEQIGCRTELANQQNRFPLDFKFQQNTCDTPATQFPVRTSKFSIANYISWMGTFNL